MEDHKPWPVFALEQDFAKERKLKSVDEKCKSLSLGDVLSKLMQLKRITVGVWGQSLQPPGAMGPKFL